MKKILLVFIAMTLFTGCTKREEPVEAENNENEIVQIITNNDNKDEANDEVDTSTLDVNTPDEKGEDNDSTSNDGRDPDSSTEKDNNENAEQTDSTSKPIEEKTEDKKPTETKPVETKPVETKPVETKPAENKPTENKQEDKNPVETKPKDVVTYKYEFVRINVIPVTTVYKDDPNLTEGHKTYIEGSDGYTEQSIRYTFVNGIQTEKVVESEYKIDMVPTVVYTGTKKPDLSTMSVDVAASKELFKLMNETRKANGLEALSWDEAIYKVALIRAKELIESFSHTRPDGSGWYELMPYGNAGENIAAGGKSASGFNKLWNDSEGHFANRIHKSFKYYGAAIIRYSDGSSFAVELFGG